MVERIPNSHPEILGKCARMKFDNEEGLEEWYEEVIQHDYWQIWDILSL